MTAKQEDYGLIAKQLAQEHEQSLSDFERLCEEIDTDGDKALSVSELETALFEHPELEAKLAVMGVGRHDFLNLYDIFDADGNGVVEFDEFIEAITTIKHHVPQTSLY